ncbi:ABC transporter substrate-binding protein [Aquibium microcysteis]|uniref:ABC transporter substrate-binding protein n=1 Tax=Aquibium microcysteis TaxID=675281 RepID=UPI00165D162D|nr:ABC transporter substrate-binding protein [Aquibium microcysteis]
MTEYRKAFALSHSLRAFALAAAVAVSAPAIAQDTQTVTIATPGAALHFYPFYVAESEGLFEKEGIRIDWVDVGAGSRQIAAVAGGSADFAVVGMQPAMTARQNGADLVSVASLFNGYAIQLVLSNAAIEKTGISPEMPIDEKVEKLQAVSVGVTGIGSTTDVLLRSWLKQRGKDVEQRLTIQPLGSPPAMFAAFEQGAVDGFMLGSPFPQQAEAAGLGKIVIDPLTESIPELEGVPYTAIITRGALTKEKPELVQRMVNALTKAMLAQAADPDGVGARLKSYFPDTDQALFDGFEPTFRGKSATTPVTSREGYQKLLDWVAIASPEPVTVTYDEFVDDSFAEKAAAELLKQ